ncbi:MAG: RNA polymerase sigma factor, partial [Solirubrobacteraceae bacterium]
AYIEPTPRSTALAEAMSHLSALDREIVMMLSADGLSSHEAASVLGLSPTAVRSRASRARHKLRTLLVEAEDDPEHPESSRTPVSQLP